MRATRIEMGRLKPLRSAVWDKIVEKTNEISERYVSHFISKKRTINSETGKITTKYYLNLITDKHGRIDN